MFKLLISLLITLCVTSFATAEDYWTQSKIVSQMVFFDLATVQSDTGIWVTAQVHLDDPKSYNVFEPTSGTSGFLIRKGYVEITQVLRGTVKVSSVSFIEKQAAAKNGDYYVRLAPTIDRFGNFTEGALLLCKLNRNVDAYSIETQLPIPQAWTKHFADFFSVSRGEASNPLHSLVALKNADWSDLSTDGEALLLFKKLLESNDYWQVAYALSVAIEETKPQQYPLTIKILKTVVDSDFVGNPDAIIFSMDVAISRFKAFSGIEYVNLGANLKSTICSMSKLENNRKLGEISLNIIKNNCQ